MPAGVSESILRMGSGGDGGSGMACGGISDLGAIAKDGQAKGYDRRFDEDSSTRKH